MEPFIGQIILFGGNFAPRGWALCHGQLLPINSYTALFAIIGTTYGGDGRTTLGLPDLRGRAPIGTGSGPGLTTRNLGDQAGEENVALNILQIPSHNHNPQISVASSVGRGGATNQPQDNYIAQGGSYATSPTSGAFMATGTQGAIQSTNVGASLNYIIALVGVYPSRS